MDMLIILLVTFLIYLNYDCWYDKFYLNKLYNRRFYLNSSDFNYYNYFIQMTINPQSSRKFIDVFKKLKFNENDVILDIGCGNGYMLLLLNKLFNFKKLYGVEIDHNIFQICKKNIKISESNNIYIYHKNVINFNIPKDVTVIYLFNPFDKLNIFCSNKNELGYYNEVIKNIKKSYNTNNRKIQIIFINISTKIKKFFQKSFKIYEDGSLFYQYQFIYYTVFEI